MEVTLTGCGAVIDFRRVQKVKSVLGFLHMTGMQCLALAIIKLATSEVTKFCNRAICTSLAFILQLPEASKSTSCFVSPWWALSTPAVSPHASGKLLCLAEALNLASYCQPWPASLFQYSTALFLKYHNHLKSMNLSFSDIFFLFLSPESLL